MLTNPTREGAPSIGPVPYEVTPQRSYLLGSPQPTYVQLAKAKKN